MSKINYGLILNGKGTAHASSNKRIGDWKKNEITIMTGLEIRCARICNKMSTGFGAAGARAAALSPPPYL